MAAILKLHTSESLIYSLIIRPTEKLDCENSATQQREIAKARSRLHRNGDDFSISSRTIDDKIIIWRSAKIADQKDAND